MPLFLHGTFINSVAGKPHQIDFGILWMGQLPTHQGETITTRCLFFVIPLKTNCNVFQTVDPRIDADWLQNLCQLYIHTSACVA